MRAKEGLLRAKADLDASELARRQLAEQLQQQKLQHDLERVELSTRLTAALDGQKQQAAASQAALEQETARCNEVQARLTGTNATLALELEAAKRQISQLEATAAQGDFAKLVAFMEPQFSAIQSELRATNARSFDLMRDLASRAVQPAWPAPIPMQRGWPDHQVDLRQHQTYYRAQDDEGRRPSDRGGAPPNTRFPENQ